METKKKTTWVSKLEKKVNSFFTGRSIYQKEQFVSVNDFLPYFKNEPDYLDKVVSLSKTSPTLARCVSTMAKFIFGNGFQNRAFAETIVNNQGETVDDLLKKACEDRALFGGCAFLITYKLGFEGYFEKDETTHVQFQRLLKSKEFVDGGVPYFGLRHIDSNERITYQRCVPFTNDKQEILQGVQKAALDSEALSEKTGKNELIQYAQLLYSFDAKPGNNVYPTCPAHAVIIDCENEFSIKKSIKRDIEGGFVASTVVTMYENYQENEQDQLNDDEAFVQNLIGEEGAKVAIVRVHSKEFKPDIDSISNQNLAQNYEYAQKSTTQSIEKMYQIPTVLFGGEQTGKLGLELLQARDFYEDVIVNSDKLVLQKVFQNLFIDNPKTVNTNASNNFAIERFIFSEEKKALEKEKPTTIDATTNI